MNPIQNMMFLTPQAVLTNRVLGITVRNDNGEIYTINAAIADFEDTDFVILEYTVIRCSDGAKRVTQIFNNVLRYVTGTKPF